MRSARPGNRFDPSFDYAEVAARSVTKTMLGMGKGRNVGSSPKLLKRVTPIDTGLSRRTREAPCRQAMRQE